MKFCHIFITSSDAKKLNTYRGSTIDKNAIVNVKYNETRPLTVTEIKSTGTFSVSGCLKCFGEKQQINSRDSTTMKVWREAVLFDGLEHIQFTVWEDLIEII